MGADVADFARQLRLDLSVPEPFSLQYFIAHSGAARAFSELSALLASYVAGHRGWTSVYLYGPKGTGKTHLAQGAICLVEKAMGPRDHFVCKDLRTEPSAPSAEHESWVGRFIKEYEASRSAGGLFFAVGAVHPAQVKNSHISSRLLAGPVYSLSYPREEELEPLLYSLLERRNLKLSERSMRYLLRRLPRDPLSFDHIFATVDELSFQQGKPAGFGVVREAAKMNS